MTHLSLIWSVTGRHHFSATPIPMMTWYTDDHNILTITILFRACLVYRFQLCSSFLICIIVKMKKKLQACFLSSFALEGFQKAFEKWHGFHSSVMWLHSSAKRLINQNMEQRQAPHPNLSLGLCKQKHFRYQSLFQYVMLSHVSFFVRREHWIGILCSVCNQSQ